MMNFRSYFIKLKFCLLMALILTVNGQRQSNFKTCSSDEICIPHYECKAVTDLTSKGRLTSEERAFLKSKFCKKTNNLDHFCCQTENKPGLGGSLDIRLSSHLPSAPECGIQLQDKITNGEEAFIDEYPWFALLQYKKPNGVIKHLCGGSLINKRFVLTAAHCHLRTGKQWKLSKVRLGEWDLRTNPDCQSITNEEICNDDHIDIPIAEVIVHPEYHSIGTAQYNDIALIRMENDVEYTNWIKPICLPLDSVVRSTDYTSHTLEVIGYGLTESGKSSNTKMRVDLDGVPQDQCRQTYSRFNVRKLFDSQICFGGKEGKDSCVGDSGGPLMKYGKFSHSKFAHFIQIGLVSFGPQQCGTDNVPGVYVRLADYMDWIIDNSQLN